MKLHLPVSLFRLLLGVLLTTATETTLSAVYDKSSILVTSADISYYSSVTISGASDGVSILSDGMLTMTHNGPVSISGNAGYGVSNKGTFSLERNSGLNISNNGGDGISNGSVSIVNDGDVTVSNNGGKGIGVTSLELIGNGVVSIENNRGGNGLLVSSGTIRNNGDIFVGSNANSGIVISGKEGDLSIEGNGTIHINDNSGMGISNAGILLLSDNVGLEITGNGNHGISGSDVSIIQNGNITVSDNTGYGITADSLLMQGNGDISISGNTEYGIFVDSLVMEGNQSICIENNTKGDGLRFSSGRLENNGDISISGNSGGNDRDSGNGITVCDGTFELKNNGAVTISGNKGNSAYTWIGNGISLAGHTLVAEGNSSLTITDNKLVGIGGATPSGTAYLLNNGEITVSNNGSGGGILVDTLVMKGNGDVRIENNGGGGFERDCGLSVTTGEIEDNGDIYITGNTGLGKWNSGNGIHVLGSLLMQGNGDITISDNRNLNGHNSQAAYSGMGICNYAQYNGQQSEVRIIGNNDITISNNGFYGLFNYVADKTVTETICGNGNINITGNDSSGIRNYNRNGGTISLTLNGNQYVTISGNKGDGISSSFYQKTSGSINIDIIGNSGLDIINNEGAGIYGSSSAGGTGTVTTVISDHGGVRISGNGGTGCSSSSLVMERNGTIQMIGNKGSGLSAGDDCRMEYNGDIEISVNGGSGIFAGAFQMNDNGNITLSNNKGDGLYNSSGTMNSNGNIVVLNNTGYGIDNQGAYYNGDTFELVGNGNMVISGNGKGGIRSSYYTALTFQDNIGLEITGNDGWGIQASSGLLSIIDDGEINISNNQGGISAGGLSMKKNNNITISGSSTDYGISLSASSYSYDSEIKNNGQISIDNNVGGGIYIFLEFLEISDNGDISLSGNGAAGISNGATDAVILSNGNITIAGNGGSGIYNYVRYSSATLTFSGNGDITISGNKAGSSGGGIRNYAYGSSFTATMTFSGNGGIAFSGNTANGDGGGICNHAQYASATMAFSGNGGITISGNTASGDGGGICNDAYSSSSTATMTFSGNGDITISGNTSSGGFGGGIYNYAYSSSSLATMTFSGNGDITISGNTAGDSGGGIYNYARYFSATMTFNGNGDITISGNTARYGYGGGIYSYNGTLDITDNQSVTFRGNLQASDTSAVLNGIYAETTDSSKVVTLAAPEMGRMDFYDPILVKMSSATTDTLLHLNGLRNEESGEYAATGGVIRLTGESTEEDLAAAYERAGINLAITPSAITASRTSSTNGHTALHGGELQIVHQAILETNGLTAEGAGHATLRLEDGTLRSTAAVTVESGATLALAGVNTLIASTLDLQDGAALEFTLGSGNAADAVLALDATLSTGSLSMQLGGLDELSSGTYKLITLADASQYSTDSWTSDLVSVIGGNFDQLSWQEGTLCYTAASIEVTDNETETITDGNVSLPIIIREGEALIQQEGMAALVMSYDSTTTDAGRLATIEGDTSFARINVGAPEGSVNEFAVAEGQTASTAALNGAGDLAKTGSGTLEITGAGDHCGTLTVQQGRVSLTGDGQLSSGTIVLGSDASAFSLRRAAARSADAPLLTTDSGITLTQNDSSRAGSLSGHEELTAQSTSIVGKTGQRAAADNLCISLENAQATFTLGNLDLNNTVVDVNAADGLILHDLRMDATSQVSNRADVLAQMTGQNSLQLGSLVSITGNGQLSTDQLYGVELASGGSLTLGMDSDLLAAAGLAEGSVAELWLAGLQVADTATLSFDDVLQADGQKLAITIQAVERATDGTRLQIAVAAVPEPATATLTLLALTALAARRRRGLRPVSALRPAC